METHCKPKRDHCSEFLPADEEEPGRGLAELREVAATAMIRQEAEGGALLADALLKCMNDGVHLTLLINFPR